MQQAGVKPAGIVGVRDVQSKRFTRGDLCGTTLLGGLARLRCRMPTALTRVVW